MSIHPSIVKGGIVVTDFITGTVRNVITFQFNPESMSRTLTARTAAESAGPLTATRYTGVAGESIRFEIMIDATDQLEVGNAAAQDTGIYPQLAVLESLVQPPSASVRRSMKLAAAGVLEVLPEIAPLPLLVWSEHRILPVLITELSFTEEMFDSNLNPIRAQVAITATVLTVDILGQNSPGGALSMSHLEHTELLASGSVQGSLADRGVKTQW